MNHGIQNGFARTQNCPKILYEIVFGKWKSYHFYWIWQLISIGRRENDIAKNSDLSFNFYR